MTVSLEVIKLRFTGPVHFGRGWGDLDHSESILHSDTLKSALFSALIRLEPDWKIKAGDFFSGVRISSCYPYLRDELFLPKLHLKREFNFEGIAKEKHAKTSKNIEYLSFNIFTRYINSDETVHINEKQLSENSKYVFGNKDGFNKKVITDQTQQRVNVKYFSESVPFFASRIFFEKECGLYFLAAFKDIKIKKDFLKAVRYLGALGIGTDRTVGNGFFEFDEDKDISAIDFLVENPDAYASLGLYLPLKEELENSDLEHSSWGLIQRSGYMAGSEYLKFRHLLKKSIFMFTEGSIFKTPAPPEGKYIDLRPEWSVPDMHEVWRCGMPVFIPVKL